ncbi:LOW QUALITY PROTEIN: hypothetical protein U9M48_030380 [Paspalum notatum var. saurae]|uniref:Uncharacterized protein n=1 Tax=Paspalum notatum var. saurae TaxID=547442 RepID=A0AAQ3U4S6_PASNO
MRRTRNKFLLRSHSLQSKHHGTCARNPSQPSNLQYLSKALNSSHNRLTSQIPSSLGSLQDLELSKNSLLNPVSAEQHDLTFDREFHSLASPLVAGLSLHVANYNIATQELLWHCHCELPLSWLQVLRAIYYIVKRSQHLSASHRSVCSLDRTEELELPEDLT